MGGDLGLTARSLSSSSSLFLLLLLSLLSLLMLSMLLMLLMLLILLMLTMLLMLLLLERQGGRESGVVVVGAGLICWNISSSTEAGVTLSIKVKEGSSRTVVGAEAEWSCCGFGGMGIFDAESISFCYLHRAFRISMESYAYYDRRWGFGGGGGVRRRR